MQIEEAKRGKPAFIFPEGRGRLKLPSQHNISDLDYVFSVVLVRLRSRYAESLACSPHTCRQPLDALAEQGANVVWNLSIYSGELSPSFYQFCLNQVEWIDIGIPFLD